jgi:alkanesulfonate monooxygenase SsuD/methylene tetrahydromethanopterin reductase-like flavin-dependent oxidoreductase (luciferase family)
MTGGPALLLNVARQWRDADAVDAAERAIGSGLDGVGFADSPRLFPDPWIQTDRVLSATPVSLAGPCLASLGLRHPATVANALRTLEHQHRGRVLTVVGRGESSVRNEGMGETSMRAYVAALRQLRSLLAADGESIAPNRVLGAASGPRTIIETVDALGGVLIDVGTDVEVITKAAILARRDHAETNLWLFLRAVVTSSEREAASAAEPLIGSCAARLVRSPEWYGISDDELEAVRVVADSHDYRRHGTMSARNSVAGDVDRLVRDRFVLTGTPSDISMRLRPLAALDVRGVVIAGAMHGVTKRLPQLATALRTGLEPANPE